MREIPPCVEALWLEREVSWSSVGSALRQALQPLIEGAVLERRRSGGGERLVVLNPAQFDAWLKKRHPGAAGASAEGALKRARGLVARRDTKAGDTLVSSSPLLLRAPDETAIEVGVDGNLLEVSALTQVAGAAVILLTDETRLTLPPIVALVENLECFLHIEHVLNPCPLALLSAGRPSERLIACLARSLPEEACLLHMPDYDPVGLDDHLRVKAALGNRVRLHVPHDLARRFETLGNASLLRDKPRNQALLVSLAEKPFPDAATRAVFELILRCGAGLEQEALFVRLPDPAP
jgi:hypothetical protein